MTYTMCGQVQTQCFGYTRQHSNICVFVCVSDKRLELTEVAGAKDMCCG